MKGIIRLRKPVRIGGSEVREMSYDTDKITVDHYMKALNRTVTKGNITGTNIKLDAGAHLALGMYAVVADNPQYEIEDVELVTGSDLMQFVDIGLGFIIGREDQTEEPSDQPSETIQEPSSPMYTD